MQPGEFLSEGVISFLFLMMEVALLYIAVMWLALVYWTARDIRRRTRYPLIQGAATALVAFLFVPGYWLYLVLRPRQTLAEVAEERFRATLFSEFQASATCPSCKERVREDFILCPRCRSALREACAGCSRALMATWQSCPYCGRATKAQQPVVIPLPAPEPVELREEVPDLAVQAPRRAEVPL